MKTIDIAAVGDNCIDQLLGKAKTTLVGGNALNVAIQAARSGLNAAYFGAAGPVGETAGDLVAALLLENSVDVSHLIRCKLPTSITRIDVLANGDRCILHEDFGACRGYCPDDKALDRILGAHHVHIGWLDDRGSLLRQLIAAGGSTSRDISINADPESLGVKDLTYVFCSLPEIRAWEAAELAIGLVSRGARNAVVTLGANGSLALIDGRTYTANALPVDAIDTTGAGDSYIAGFLSARLRSADVLTAMQSGHALAARTCQHMGGFPQSNKREQHAP